MKIEIYTDGACSNNGKKNAKAGIGIYFSNINIDPISQRVPIDMDQTNNVAELLAIKIAIETIIKHNLKNNEIIIYTDSQYSINVITNCWKAKVNIGLINEIKQLLKILDCVRLIYIPGHKDNKGNNIADELARKSIN